MAKKKERGFSSWLGFGQKEQTPEKEAEVQNEQPVIEEIVQMQGPVRASEYVVEEQPQAHTEVEAEILATNIMEVAEQIAESEKAQPEVEVTTQLKSVVEETPEPMAIEREELPLSEDVNVEAVSPEEWQVEAETVEIVEAAEEGAAREEVTDEELEAQALAAEVAKEAIMMVSLAEEEQSVEEIVQEQERSTRKGSFARLKRNLLKARENLGSGFISLLRGKKISDDLFEELEKQLLIADVGTKTTREIITNLMEGASHKQFRGTEAFYGLLKEEIGEVLAKVDESLNVEGETPFAILMVNVNDVGKTTTIGKLMRQFEQQGKSVTLAVGGTSRTAAVEQLQAWGQHNNAPMVAQHTGADSVSAILDVTQAAKVRSVDVLVVGTAGRPRNKSYLMEELKRTVRVMKKLDVEALYEIMLTIDVSTGQNGVNQARLSYEAVGLTGITLMRLNGITRDEVILSAADQFDISIRCVGVGERTEGSHPFKADDFTEALFVRED